MKAKNTLPFHMTGPLSGRSTSSEAESVSSNVLTSSCDPNEEHWSVIPYGGKLIITCSLGANNLVHVPFQANPSTGHSTQENVSSSHTVRQNSFNTMIWFRRVILWKMSKCNAPLLPYYAAHHIWSSQGLSKCTYGLPGSSRCKLQSHMFYQLHHGSLLKSVVTVVLMSLKQISLPDQWHMVQSHFKMGHSYV